MKYSTVMFQKLIPIWHLKPTAPQIVAYLLPILLGILTTNTAFTADANPPEKMAYQGYMTDSNGDPLGATAPANYDTVFRIWSVLEGNASTRSLMVRTTDGDLRQGLLQRAARRGANTRVMLEILWQLCFDGV